MKRRALITMCFVTAGLQFGCSGGDDGEQMPPPDEDRDGGTPMGPRDGGPVVQPNDDVSISGTAYRLDAYLEGVQVPLAGATVRALGVNGVGPVGTEADGAYSIRVPQNGAVILAASKPDYLQSYEQLEVGGTDINGKNFLMAYTEHITRLAERFGIMNWDQPFTCHAPNTGQCKYVVVMGRVLDDGTEGNGTPTPLGNVEKDEFTFRGNSNTNWYVKGPYFFLFNGQPTPNTEYTQRRRNDMTGKYEGGLYMYFVEFPQLGTDYVDIEVSAGSYAGGPANRYFGPARANVQRDSFTWLNVGETGIAPPPPDDPPPPPPQDVDFDTQVYPLFGLVADGGFGCLGCHTSYNGATPAGGMDLYGGPAAAYGALDPASYPQRVNVQSPGNSLLLTKPLYEADGNQNHPIFAFVNAQDPAYQLIYGWIQGGGLRVGGPPLQPVSFYNDVRPILYADQGNGGAGCYNCHVNGVNVDNAPGGAYFGGNANELYDVLTNQTPSDNGLTGEQYRINKNGNTGQSLLLLNPTQGNNEPHPAKLFFGAEDPRYQTIYRWIAEGYENDAPP
ncbi:MAG: hypothetical protein RMA76_15580 [Deltaproteobacteria bacterium]|jgi:hypothetical protein